MAACSIRVVLRVNGGPLTCPVYSLQQPHVAALISCLPNESEISVHSLHLRPRGPSLCAFLALDLRLPLLCLFAFQRNASTMNCLNTHGGSWPRVSSWPLGCLKKDVCDSLGLTHWLSSVVFLTSQ